MLNPACDCEAKRPFWQDLLMVALPILIAEAAIVVQDHYRQARKEARRRDKRNAREQGEEQGDE
jgi:hypothetical protein